jgi:hypothetical protein
MSRSALIYNVNSDFSSSQHETKQGRCEISNEVSIHVLTD